MQSQLHITCDVIIVIPFYHLVLLLLWDTSLFMFGPADNSMVGSVTHKSNVLTVNLAKVRMVILQMVM